MNKYKAKNITELMTSIVAATSQFDNHLLWWRGQASSDWDLIPSIHHKKLSENESNLAARFSSQAKVRHSDVPDSNDGTAWLFLMQHYGLPTRLLDWSQSPLTALFFAINELHHHDKDGVIWGMAPTYLNKFENGQETIFGESSAIARPIFSAAWNNEKTKKIQTLATAITSQHIDVRQMIQASEFTIHNSDQSMHTFPNSEKYLAKIIVPKESKLEFSNSLDILNISESKLFPDLEHLAKELVNTRFANVTQAK